MVYIYGGGYAFGTGEMFPGYGLALHGDMIVVNFNYRVSTLGYLSTGQCNQHLNIYYTTTNQMIIISITLVDKIFPQWHNLLK